MGTWNTGLFSDDVACDLRDHYREPLEDGVEDAEATSRTLVKFRRELDDPDEGPLLIVALAVTQSRVGRLDPAIRTRALTALDSGAETRLEFPRRAGRCRAPFRPLGPVHPLRIAGARSGPDCRLANPAGWSVPTAGWPLRAARDGSRCWPRGPSRTPPPSTASAIPPSACGSTG